MPQLQDFAEFNRRLDETHWLGLELMVFRKSYPFRR
jgi:hypothetical protein